MAAIEFQGVSKTFDGGRTWAVRELDLRVEEGELLCVVGTSGSGKTTALKTINRLVDPTAGRVRVLGRDVAGLDPVALRRSIGYTIQAVGLLPHLDVAANVGLVPRLLGWSRARIAERVDALLEQVSLEPAVFRRRFPAELSGGEAQRVGFARALAAEPRILLMDEPFGALDPVIREELQVELQRWVREFSVTSVLVTHDVVEALLLGDRVAVLHGGRLLAVGTPAALRRQPLGDRARRLLEAPGRLARRLAEREALE